MSTVTPDRRAWVEQIMGLPVSVHVRGPAPAGAEHRVRALFGALRTVDRVFSTYRDDSELSRWERGELPLALADPMLAEVLVLCEEARGRTDGWFDARSLPDPRTGRLRFDPSGLVKGWAVERAAARLAGLADHDWCVNAGGDIVVSTAGTGRPWRAGLEDPADPRRVAAVVPLTGGALATSGRTHRGRHIVDPRSGRPADAVRAVSVRGPSLLWADVYATAAVARGEDAAPWIEDRPGYEALVNLADGTVRTTTGWFAPCDP